MSSNIEQTYEISIGAIDEPAPIGRGIHSGYTKIRAEILARGMQENTFQGRALIVWYYDAVEGWLKFFEIPSIAEQIAVNKHNAHAIAEMNAIELGIIKTDQEYEQ